MKRGLFEVTQTPMTDYQGLEQYIIDQLKKRLPAVLTYHSYNHVMDVLDAAMRIAAFEKINGEDLKLLRIGALFHDSGFMNTTVNHEEEGCRIVKDKLPEFGFNEEQIEKVCGMILSTKIPQSPKNRLEEILCDADLDYLGRDDFYSIGHQLFSEMKIYHNVKTELEWNKIQLNFLKSHAYHTSWSFKFREERKQEHLNEIIKLVENY